MKNLTLFLLLSTFNLLAQAPEKMSYQSVIRNSSNSLVVNQSVRLRISILHSSITGSAVYSEQHQTTSNSNGLVTISIGAGTSQTGSFSAINWQNGPYFVKMEADPTGGTNYTVSGTSQLLSVPYALHAKTADMIVGGATGGFTHYIGEQFGGGVVFSIWKDAQGVEHGLIVDLTDLGSQEPWSNVRNEEVGSSAQSDWDGLNNSYAIVSQVGHTNSAAYLCLNSTNGGFSDWYLPAVLELKLLYQNLLNVNKTLSTIGAQKINLLSDYYSSTEFNYESLLGFRMGNGQIWWLDCLKMGYALNIRAIRAF